MRAPLPSVQMRFAAMGGALSIHAGIGLRVTRVVGRETSLITQLLEGSSDGYRWHPGDFPCDGAGSSEGFVFTSKKTQMSRYLARFYPETTFGGFTDVDGTVAFYGRINALVQPSFSVLDFGCGRGGHADDSVSFRRQLRSFKGRVGRVIGVDVDSIGASNTSLDEFRLLAPDQPWPIDRNSIDLIICDFVLEHLSNPPAFFAEARRVLVPGGYLCIRTPNVLSYVGLISKLAPNKYHKAVSARVQSGRKEQDIFQTVYKCNTISALRKQMKANSFRAVVYGYDPEPSYLEFSKLAYALGVLYQKCAPSFASVSIFAFGQLE